MNKHNPNIINNWVVTTACITLKENTKSKHKSRVLHVGSDLQGDSRYLGPKCCLNQIRLF